MGVGVELSRDGSRAYRLGYDFPPLTWVVDVYDLLATLRGRAADVVEFNVTDGSAPMLIEIGKLQYILMPITAS